MKKSAFFVIFTATLFFFISSKSNPVVHADDNQSTTQATQISPAQPGNNNEVNQSNNQNSVVSNDKTETENKVKPAQPQHHYDAVTSRHNENYKQIIKKSVARYHAPYNTDNSSIKQFATTQRYVHKWVNVKEIASTNKNTYAHVFYGNLDMGWINKSALDQSSFRLNNVPLIGQRPQLPTGCEITAVTMMINYASKKKYTKIYMAKKMPRSSNPNKGFVGNPFKKSGWYIFPPALMKLVRHYLGSSKLFTGKSTAFLKNYLKTKKRPIVVYVGKIDGFPNHAVTVTGFSKSRIYFNDPWTDKRTSLSNKKFEFHRNYVHKKAIGY